MCGLGHSHPLFTGRVAEQLAKLVHVSNLYFNEQQILAAKAIVDRCFGARVFFCNSSAEANEGAIKLARRYQAVVAEEPHRTTIVATNGSFHGRSIATISLTGQPKYREGFGPLFGPVEFIVLSDAKLIDSRGRVVRETGELTLCPNIVTSIAMNEGPSGRDLKAG